MRDGKELTGWDADDLEILIGLGRALDEHPHTVEWTPGFAEKLKRSKAETVRDFLIEAIVRVRNKHRKLVQLKPNRAQQEYSKHCSRRNIVLKARQVGITTYVAARFFIQTITQPGTVSLQVAHDQESAEQIFRMVHRFWENLPVEVQQGALRTSRANVRQIAFPSLDSEYRVATAADADAGRGTTVHNLHCSEVARWPGDPQETLSSLRATAPEEGNIVLESTPNGAGGTFYEEWQQADETGYTRHFFPWWYDKAYRMKAGEALAEPLTEEEQALMERAGLSLEQIAWRRTTHAQLRGLALQEYAEDATTCFLQSAECVFDLRAIDRASAVARDPVEILENQRLRIWFPAQKGKEYVIGVDPAGGGRDGDYCCAQVIERETALQCAEWHGHYPPREFAAALARLGGRYNGALLVVERNNHGYGVLAHLENAKYQNIYREGNKAGWPTTAVTRPAMIEDLAETLATQPELFQSTRLMGELLTFVRQRDGSAAATAGAHDDCVMAMAIALGARKAVAGERWKKREEEPVGVGGALESSVTSH